MTGINAGDRTWSVPEGPTTRRVFLRRFGGGIVALTAAQMLAACGDSDDGADAPNATEVPNSGKELKHGGTLRLAFGNPDRKGSPDPFSVIIGAASVVMQRNVYDRLVVRGKDFKLELQGAEEITPKDGGAVWDVRLRENMAFHDGRPVTADDLIASVRRATAKDTTYAPYLTFVDPTRLKKMDTRTVRFPLREPVGIFRTAAVNIVVVPSDFDGRKPIGSGPFKFVSMDPGRRSELVRFDDYWGGPAYLDRLIVTEIGDPAARANALLGREIDATESVPTAQVRVLESASGVAVFHQPTASNLVFTMRTDVEPYNDVRVRQALRLVVNRKNMIKQALGDDGVVANDTFAGADSCVDASLTREQNVDEARQLLEQAGANDFEFELTSTPLWNGMNEAAQAFVEQAKQAGVKVKLRTVDVDTWSARYKEWPFSVSYYLARDYLEGIALAGLPTSPYNEPHFDDAEFNKLYAQATREVDEAKRCEISKQMQKIEFERGGYIVWAHPVVTDAFTDELGGLYPDKTGLGFNGLQFSKIGYTV
jgi:peptide/nickel transport system substrate-binding protein